MMSRISGAMPRLCWVAGAFVLVQSGPTFAQAAPPASAPAAATPPSPSAPAPQADPVVAKVNGKPILLSDVSEAAKTLPPQMQGMPAKVLFPMVLDQLVDREALVHEARKDGLDKDPAVQAQMAAASERALQTALIAKQVGPLVTEQAVRARYDQEIAGKPGEEEVHARHILVPSEAEAKDIIAQLKKGADFATLAKQKSKDPGAAQGGDLGFFKKTDMVPEFADAAFALKPGQFSQVPVHTQFGWHVIKVDERKRDTPPTYEQAHDELRQKMIQEDVQKVLAEARKDSTIERFNLDGSPAGAASAPPSPSPSPAPQPAPASSPRNRAPRLAPTLSPLALELPDLRPFGGIRLGAAEAGIRYQGRTDLVMIEMPKGTTAAGVFTRNKCPGAPVDWCRAALARGRARGLVVNAGNANVFTGRAGRDACTQTAAAAAALLGCPPKQVLLASTGVIGEVLPHERLTGAMPGLHASLNEGAWEAAARGIMTTDTFPKAAVRTARIGDAEVRICGIAKGSGMIAPDMATMLCFVFTDAKIPADLLDPMLRAGVDASFNRTTVDSDTSTSDTVLLFATGQAEHPRVPERDGSNAANRLLRDFSAKLNSLLLDLALQVVRDGEGAQKLIRIDVTGAVSAKSARRIAMAVANSPLVKTAVAGEDANWGRIVMAVGKAGEPADRDRLSIGVGGIWMARDGGVVPGYDEAPVAAHMKGREIKIAIDLGLGRGSGIAWTCDLTHGYIDINGSYRS